MPESASACRVRSGIRPDQDGVAKVLDDLTGLLVACLDGPYHAVLRCIVRDMELSRIRSRRSDSRNSLR